MRLSESAKDRIAWLAFGGSVMFVVCIALVPLIVVASRGVVLPVFGAVCAAWAVIAYVMASAHHRRGGRFGRRLAALLLVGWAWFLFGLPVTLYAVAG